MANNIEVVKNLFEKHIAGTLEKAIVSDVTISICKLTKTVNKQMELLFECDCRVYINTRVLQHLYDKKPAEEFAFIVDNVHKIAKYPDCIYKNKDPKRGDVCFTKRIGGENYMCSLEMCEREDGSARELFVVTSFRIRKENYLNNYELLWSWRDDTLSS